MAYATKADLQKRITDARLVQLTDFDGSGEMDDTRITEALDLATSAIDSYTSGRYTLPLVGSNQVKDLCVTLAVHKLYEGRQLAPPEMVAKQQEDAMRLLRDVSGGKAALDQPAKTQATEMDVKTVDHTDPDKQDVFDPKKLEAY